MILKFRCGDAWRIIDNITEADLIHPTDEQATNGIIGMIQYSRNGEYLKQQFEEPAFLLNDNGKTIERLDNPFVHMVPTQI